ncbi:hypothetical protein [Streptomyces sp. NPDC051452]|uniref:hypothetical protein n=1 Tax=Streptomyces sp. NPDC051452 TaxID=3365654 RepID=UPI0037B54C27
MSATVRAFFCTTLLALAALCAGAGSESGTATVTHTEAAAPVPALPAMTSGPQGDNGWW